jgi:hypothetical protein
MKENGRRTGKIGNSLSDYLLLTLSDAFLEVTIRSMQQMTEDAVSNNEIDYGV